MKDAPTNAILGQIAEEAFVNLKFRGAVPSLPLRMTRIFFVQAVIFAIKSEFSIAPVCFICSSINQRRSVPICVISVEVFVCGTLLPAAGAV